MAEFDDTLQADPNVEELPSFDIALSPTGDAGSSFRTQNDPSSPFQRSVVIQRDTGALDIRCQCKDVIHGRLSPRDDAFATLIVLQFRFDSRKRARRIQSVNISLEFSGIELGSGGPEVYAIAPNGRYGLLPTEQHEEVTHTSGVQLGGAAPVGGITATGSLGWEKTVSRDAKDQTTVVGSIDLKGRNWGKPNAASWTLLENKTTRGGVPAAMQTAILVKRKDEEPFACVVKIDALVDFRSKMERVLGGKGRDPEDDPVLFDPGMMSQSTRLKCDTEDLSTFDLASISDITSPLGTIF